MDRRTIEVIKRYKQELRTLGIRPQRVILYGSRAKREASEHSDIDVVVISRDFTPYEPPGEVRDPGDGRRPHHGTGTGLGLHPGGI